MEMHVAERALAQNPGEIQRQLRQEASLREIIKLISSHLALDEILQTAVEAIYDKLEYSNIALLLRDPGEPNVLVLRACSGIYRRVVGEYRQGIDEGVIGAAARTRQPILVPDVRRESRYIPIPGAPEIRFELAVPILARAELLGVLNIESEQDIPVDADGLQIIADQLGIAIDNAQRYAHEQQALAEMKLLYATSGRISAAMDVDQVIAAYLEQVAARGHYTCNVALYECDAAGERTGVIVRGRWSRTEGLCLLNERVPYSRDALDPPLDAGKTIRITNVNADPRVSRELVEIQTQARRPALALIPLMAHGERIGLVILSYHEVHAWSDADLRLYQATAAQLANAIDSRRQQTLAYERARQLAVLEERQRLARELHDSITQLLFSMTLIAQSISPAWKRNQQEGEQRLARLLELSQQALAEMRILLSELRPGGAVPLPAAAPASTLRLLRDQGLVPALQAYIAGVAPEGLQVQLEAESYTPRASAQELVLLRIAQEAFNNVVKHARATRVHIRLDSPPQALLLTVEDNGIGFALDSLPERGLGMASMRERVEPLRGSVQIHTAPGRGTRVQVMLPQDDL